MPIYMRMNARQPRGYCDHARRLFPGLDTSRCVERSYASNDARPLGARAVRALCSDLGIELIAETASFGAALLHPASGPVLGAAIKFGLREFCDYALRHARQRHEPVNNVRIVTREARRRQAYNLENSFRGVGLRDCLDGCREEHRDCLDGCRWELEDCLASCRGRGCREECRAEYEACLEECRADFEACEEECREEGWDKY